MDCPPADGHQFTRHVFLLSATTTETVYKQLKNKKKNYIKKETNKIIDIICCGFFFSRSRSDVFNFTAHLNSSRLAHAWLSTDSIIVAVWQDRYQRLEIYEVERIQKNYPQTRYRMTSDVFERDVVRE